MPTPIGPARGRRPEVARPDPSATATVWRRLAGTLGFPASQDEREDRMADRGHALAAFVRGDPVPAVWPRHVQPMLEQFYDETLASLLDAFRTGAPSERVWYLGGALASIEKWAQALDETITLGAGAMQRIAQRRVRGAVAAEAPAQEPTMK